jgi:signal peptidase I
VLYERLSPRLLEPSRQRLLVYQGEEGIPAARRVVARSGEQVRVVEGSLEIDGTRLALPAGVERYVAAGHLRRPGAPAWRVPAGEVLVLGDQPSDAWDGRFFGGLPPERWAGRAVCVVWPPERWRWLW